MENEKRTLLAFVLIAAFLYVWFEFFVPKPPPKTAEEKPALSKALPAEVAAERPAGQEEALKVEAPKAKPAVPQPKAVEIPFSTDLVNGTWTSRGGTLDYLTLKDFLKVQGGEESVDVIPFKPGTERAFLWRYLFAGEDIRDEDIVFDLVEKGPGKVIFRKELRGKILVEKEFRWAKDSYTIDHELRVVNLTGQPTELRVELSMSSAKGEGRKGGLFSGPVQTPLSAVAYINESSVRLTPEDILEKEAFPEGPTEWAALDSHYFLVAAIPVEGLWQAVEGKARPTEGNKEKAESVSLWMKYAPKTLAPSAQSSLKLKLYGGPKDISLLHGTHKSLDRVIDLGDWLGPIARAILNFLRFLYGLLGNYGLAILALTVTVRLLMFPLAQMQAKSMKKMQQHKPQMDALKEKYKDEKEVYSRELMAYMKSHKINPMGGCLLLLPQLPIFFALYRVLYNSIELRHSPFAFWIVDLSAKDPFFVMPILLGIAMFFQTRLTPSPGADPMQQNMMKMMPVMFTVFMLFLPAGLNLYILISTLWGIGQQLWVQRDMKVIMPPQKKAGSK